MERFSNGAILKWSDLGSPPYAIFQDPKNREIWHAMCYITPAALPAWSVEYSGSLDVITHCALEETELTHCRLEDTH